MPLPPPNPKKIMRREGVIANSVESSNPSTMNAVFGTSLAKQTLSKGLHTQICPDSIMDWRNTNIVSDQIFSLGTVVPLSKGHDRTVAGKCMAKNPRVVSLKKNTVGRREGGEGKVE